jgi:hypothetical protein
MAGNTETERSQTVDNGSADDLSMGSGTRIIVSTMPEVREASLRGRQVGAAPLLSIFTQDLEPLIYGEEPFLEAIKRLVLARSYAKVRVLLADPSRAMVGQQSLSGAGAAPHQLHRHARDEPGISRRAPARSSLQTTKRWYTDSRRTAGTASRT